MYGMGHGVEVEFLEALARAGAQQGLSGWGQPSSRTRIRTLRHPSEGREGLPLVHMTPFSMELAWPRTLTPQSCGPGPPKSDKICTEEQGRSRRGPSTTVLQA
jgi:hypothetical protein